MRDYATVRHTFWTKGSGKKLRGDRDAQLIGLYLITSEAASITGIYYLPLPTLCHHLALDLEGARKALRRVSSADLAHYDEDAELVWVPNLAEQEMGEKLSPADKRHKGLQRALASLGKHRFVKDFYSRYAAPYALEIPDWARVHSEGPSEPLRSQNQNQNQIQNQDQSESQGPPAREPASSGTRETATPVLTHERKAAADMLALRDVDLVWVKFVAVGAWRTAPDLEWAWQKFAAQEVLYQRRDRERDRERDAKREENGSSGPARAEWKPKRSTEPLADDAEVQERLKTLGLRVGSGGAG